MYFYCHNKSLGWRSISSVEMPWLLKCLLRESKTSPRFIALSRIKKKKKKKKKSKNVEPFTSVRMQWENYGLHVIEANEVNKKKKKKEKDGVEKNERGAELVTGYAIFLDSILGRE